MDIYRIQKKQSLPADITTAWNFLSNPGNLKLITPPDMGFDILSNDPLPEMYAGQIISYKIKPFTGIALTWVTEITHVNEPFYFVDEQRFGPYKFWHHQHHLKEIPGGVEMTDIIHYALPLGFLGNIANKITVRKKLNEIFAFRFHKLESMFGKYVRS